MPEEFPVPSPLNDRGWKVKIRDRERVEPPHVTVLWKTYSWRFGLRERDFLDEHPDPKRVPFELLVYMQSNTDRFTAAWNSMYPENPL
jgi:hypothetical protein